MTTTATTQISNWQTAFTWVKECIATIRQQPLKWLAVAFAYLVIFLLLPAGLPLVISYALALLYPTFLVLAVSLYREADAGRATPMAMLINNIKHAMMPLLLLGLICVAYSFVVAYFTEADSVALKLLVDSKAEPQQILAQALPLLLKALIFLAPLMMATWFAPMLIAFQGLNVLQAIKSSIAGSIQGMLPMGLSWLIITFGMALLMIMVGIVFGLISVVLPTLGIFLTSVFLIVSFLFATALMLAFQYVTYRDICHDIYAASAQAKT